VGADDGIRTMNDTSRELLTAIAKHEEARKAWRGSVIQRDDDVESTEKRVTGLPFGA
jgi:hypothetical protein